jgi:hypothetical protein
MIRSAIWVRSNGATAVRTVSINTEIPLPLQSPPDRAATDGSHALWVADRRRRLER